MILQNRFDISMEYELPSGYIEAVVKRQAEELFDAMIEKIEPEREYRIMWRKHWYEDPGRYVKGYKMGMFIEELIRCKDCKYCKVEGRTTNYMWCRRFGEQTNPSDFCSKAEKK